MKPRLCRSSWRAFASTHPLALPSTSPRKALLACPPFPPWNLLSFTEESTLSSPSSRSDLPLSRQGTALVHLDYLPPHDLEIWTDGFVPFPFGKGGLAHLPTTLFVALRPLFSFWQAQYVQVFPNKPAPFCKLFSDLGSTNKSSNSHLFSSYLTLALSSPPCLPLRLSCYLNLSGRSGRNCLLSPSVLSGYNGFSDTHSTRKTTRLTRWPDGEHYSFPLQFLVVSLLLSLVFFEREVYCLIEILRYTNFLDFH